jgi:universal stress protein E
MRPIRRILLAIKDPSAKSLPALDKAVQLARAFGASLELFHAIGTHVYTGFDLEGDDLAEVKNTHLVQTLAKLEAIAQPVREQLVPVRTAAEWDYPPHEAIVRHALRTQADLVIAECHAGPRRMPLLMHLTDWELLRFSPAPVLLVRTPKPYRKPVILAAVDPTHANAKPARLDEEIVAAASAMKKGLKGSLHAVHAYVPVPDDVKPSELLDEKATQTLERRARLHARGRLDKVIRDVKLGRGHRHLVARHPVNAIPELARRIHSDIVVMGAISRSGLKRLLIGNTAERIIDDLGCDVLVVKPKDFVTPVQARPRGMRVHTPPLPMAY